MFNIKNEKPWENLETEITQEAYKWIYNGNRHKKYNSFNLVFITIKLCVYSF